MRRMAAGLLLALMSALSWTATAELSEQQLDAARALAEAGLDLFERGDYAAAYERFSSADAIYHAPPHVLFMARSKARQGQLLAARKHYEQLVAEPMNGDVPPAFFDARQSAVEELAALDQRLPLLTVVVNGPPANAVRLTVDGLVRNDALAQAISLDPGTHDLTINASGYRAEVQSVDLSEGVRERVVINLIPGDAGGAGSTSLAGPVVLLSIAGAGLAVGAIMGGLAFARADDLTGACPDRTACPLPNKSLEDEARTFGAVSTVSFVVGGAVAVGGLVWLLVAWPESEESETATIRPTFDGSQLGVELRF